MSFAHKLLLMRHAYTPTLPELQAFVQAARTGTATRAAAALGLTQSAISRALTTLEARLGVALFHRIRQRLVLSDAGRALLPEAERMLDDLDRAALTVMSFGGHRAVLRLAVLPTFAAMWLIPRLSNFAVIAPEVTFDMTATLTPLDFERDPRDVAIIRAQGPLRGAIMDVVSEERLVVVAAPNLLPKAGMLDDADLAKLPLLQQATRPNLWLDWFLNAGLDPITILRGARFEQFGMVLAAARAGLGLALVPETFVTPDLATGALRLASARSMTSDTPYALTYPQRSLDIVAFRQFRNWILTDMVQQNAPQPQSGRLSLDRAP
ncbi:LysR substrate-binding domain-containing protein [Pseudorhodobacter ferrugineus]|uniref:LysR substrate-binding domain-containing protein n=1 Tax=Pseudorhodobacter ferrugineus TaxID=77008 RepID=UPI0004212F91|nr:LysR substrate-binding domain-containing protein [Pseudorhodobacter ferrugineus]